MPVAAIAAEAAPNRSSVAKSSITTEAPVGQRRAGAACPASPRTARRRGRAAAAGQRRARRSPSSSDSTIVRLGRPGRGATLSIAARSRSSTPPPPSASALSSLTAACCSTRCWSAVPRLGLRDRERDQLGEPGEAAARPAGRCRRVCSRLISERAPQTVRRRGSAPQRARRGSAAARRGPSGARRRAARRSATPSDAACGPGQVELRADRERRQRRRDHTRPPGPTRRPRTARCAPASTPNSSATSRETTAATAAVSGRAATNSATRCRASCFAPSRRTSAASARAVMSSVTPTNSAPAPQSTRTTPSASDADLARIDVDDAVLVGPGAVAGVDERLPPGAHVASWSSGWMTGRPSHPRATPSVVCPGQLRPALADRDRLAVDGRQPDHHRQRVDRGDELGVRRSAERPAACRATLVAAVESAWIVRDPCHPLHIIVTGPTTHGRGGHLLGWPAWHSHAIRRRPPTTIAGRPSTTTGTPAPGSARPVTARLGRRGARSRRARARPRPGAHARCGVRHGVPHARSARLRGRPRPEPGDGRDRAGPAPERRRGASATASRCRSRQAPSTGSSPATSTGTCRPTSGPRSSVKPLASPASSWSSTARCGPASTPRAGRSECC